MLHYSQVSIDNHLETAYLCAGSSIHNHLHNVLPPLLLSASTKEAGSKEQVAAEDALNKVAGAVGEEGIYLLIGELEKALEDPSRRVAAADCLKGFCQTTKLDFQEHVQSLITVSTLSQRIGCQG